MFIQEISDTIRHSSKAYNDKFHVKVFIVYSIILQVRGISYGGISDFLNTLKGD